MATQEPRHFTYSFSLGLLCILVALACFVAALCFAEAWLTVGTWQEWAAGGFIASTLAKIL